MSMDHGENNLSEFLEESDPGGFGSSSDYDILSILEALESDSNQSSSRSRSSFEFPSKSAFPESDQEPKCKRHKSSNIANSEGELEPKMSHIAVERNRRKQMNHHLSVLRSLMPGFYVKRGDQASIIGGVINYINELQQVMQSLEAKKQRKLAAADHLHILSPRPVSSPRKPPLSPRIISPRTPTPLLQTGCSYQLMNSPLSSPNCNSSSNSSTILNEQLVATSKSAIAEVEVRFCGPNLVLKTVSHRIPGQLVKIISALQHLPLEILQLNINKQLDQTMLNSFTIKIGIECQLSAEELAQQIQRTFS